MLMLFLSSFQDVQWWLISTSSCISSCFLHAPVGDPFANSAIHSTIWIHWVELTWSSPRAPKISGNLWNIAHSRTNERATKLRIADLRQVFGFNDRNATLQVDFLTHRLHSNSNSSTVLCFTEQNSNSVSFSQSQCYRLRKIPLTKFSSQVDVVRRSCPSQVSNSTLSLRFSIESVVRIFDVRNQFLRYCWIQA